MPTLSWKVTGKQHALVFGLVDPRVVCVCLRRIKDASTVLGSHGHAACIPFWFISTCARIAHADEQLTWHLALE